MLKFEFPKDFYWGSATSAHQVEGGNNNDWSEWEKKNVNRLANEASRKIFSYHEDRKTGNPEATKLENYISGQACDHYNRFREDFDIVKLLGHNVHRFSIEWYRIEPTEGDWNEKEIVHYQEVVNALRERGMEPFVTLWHWTLPLWITQQGGWENKKTIFNFAKYCQKIINSIQGVKFWITLNEPDLWAWNSYVKGIWPPQKKKLLRYIVVINNLIGAHKKVYKIIHSNALQNAKMQVQIGVAKNNIDFDSSKFNIIGLIIQIFGRFWWNHYFLQKIKNHQDFIGLNYYFHKHFGYKFYEKKSDLGWNIFPQGILHLLRELKKYKKPIFITENGIADAKDEKRADFIQQHIKWIAKALKEGVNVRGYMYWSLLDNFEWDKGFWPRFGLVEVDYQTMKRKIRQSAYEYKKIIQENSIEV